ncbi:hypothetical protein LTS16_019745 [Friedmanniomyces endolithicus]|nr:hypothetical protein LTS16_019745 [Friedmanniomyces endolithicus]
MQKVKSLQDVFIAGSSHERPHDKVQAAHPFSPFYKISSEPPLSNSHSIIQTTSSKNLTTNAIQNPLTNTNQTKMATMKFTKLPSQHVGNSIPMPLFFTFTTTTTTTPSSSANPRVFNDLIMVNLAASTLDSLNAYITERFERNVYKFKREQGGAAKRDIYEVVGMRVV